MGKRILVEIGTLAVLYIVGKVYDKFLSDK